MATAYGLFSLLFFWLFADMCVGRRKTHTHTHKIKPNGISNGPFKSLTSRKSMIYFVPVFCCCCCCCLRCIVVLSNCLLVIFFGPGSAEISGLSTGIRSSVGLRNLQVGSRQSKGTQSIYNPYNMTHSLIPYCTENSCFSFCLRRPQSFQWSPGLCKYDSVERKHGNTTANSILPSIQAF